MHPWPLFLLLSLWWAAGPEPRLESVRATVIDNHVQVTVDFQDAFEPDVVERIESGLPTGFTYEFRLLRDRKRWWDAGLDSSTLEVAAMYNAVSREYLVNFKLDGRLIESRISRDLVSLENAMTRIEKLELFDLEEVAPGTRCLVRARVRLGSRTLFSLIPTRVETDWRESAKFRVPTD